MSSKQEDLQFLFDTSFAHVWNQGRPSMDGRLCSYRSADGYGCGAAPFILKYDEDMERHAWVDLATNKAHEHLRADGCFNELALSEKDFVQELQRAHDIAADDSNPLGLGVNLDQFKHYYLQRMRDVADRFQLTYKNPTVEE